MSEQERTLEFEVEVAGTPEQVWTAIATSGGVSSWYVPHSIEEHEGGSASARFGTGPEMEVPGRVKSWEPPGRMVIDGGEDVEGLAFEWLVEARDGGTCIVRLVNSGFGSGEEWDAMYDGMNEGWQMFLRNLQLHLDHFAGRTATAALPTAMWSGDKSELWQALAEALGLGGPPTMGQQVTLQATDDLMLVGEVAGVAPFWYAVVLDRPVAGTALIALEGSGEQLSLSIWFYLYDDDGRKVVDTDEARWQAWMDQLTGAGEPQR